ncbi:hypothetical protein V6N12_039387 [Hibiscus sabdariffa]|uniref:Protein LATERAL ROOT PRIMORDIUM 1-like n=1 Tax=Hibiscus sabdariffa TaxID=183260 RepID=A0ABR2E0W1_9ROSI
MIHHRKKRAKNKGKGEKMDKKSKQSSLLYIYNFVTIIVIVATTRRQLPSDSGATADWATPSSTTFLAGPDDLSLGFNANSAAAAAAAAPSVSTNTQWPPLARPVNYGFPPEMGMVGLRDFVVVTPASFNHHHAQDPIMANDQINATNAPTALGVIPLLTAARCLAPQNVEDPDLLNSNGRNKFTRMQLWQNHESPHYLNKSSSVPDNNNSSSMNLMQSGGGCGTGGGSGGSGSSSGATCQDCGNQAKKGCAYRRCRTCCKSRSFDCPTHVKSTWVPAARRRERQIMAAGAAAAAVGGSGLSGSTAGPKKPRLTTSQTTTISHTSTSNATPPRSYDTSCSPQNAGVKETLPPQVHAPAVFKCVRVTAVEDGENEFAYEAVVKIGGHVFKGLLYDQGVDGGDRFPYISDLHLGGAGGVGGECRRNGGSSSSPVLDPSEVYEAATGGGFLGGSTYGNSIN